MTFFPNQALLLPLTSHTIKKWNNEALTTSPSKYTSTRHMTYEVTRIV